MRKFVLLLALVLAALAPQLFAQYSEFPGLKKTMSADVYKAAGLSKLTDEQRARLDEFVREYLSETAPPKKKAVAKKTEHPAEKTEQPAEQTEPPAEKPEKTEKVVEDKSTDNPPVIESRISGSFSGYNGQTVFTLANGQKWKQATDESATFPESNSPRVILVKEKDNYRMYIVGGGDITVQRVKSSSQ